MNGGEAKRRSLHIMAHNGSAILGGAELATVRLLAGLQGRGHRVGMLCRDRRMAERIGRYGIPTGVLRIGGHLMIHDALRFAYRLRRLRPDVALLTTFKKVTLAAPGARLAGVPFIVQRIGLEGDNPGRGARYRLALRRYVDAIVVNAETMRAAFLDPSAGLEPTRVVTVLGGVRAPERTGEPGAVRRTLGIGEDAVVIGAVARLARQKRFDRLVRALATLPDRVHCVIAGDGEERDALARLAGELGVAGRVHLLGFRRDVGDVLDALDVFVVSSEREGLANAMLEAMAAGVPVVSTAVSGATEALAPESEAPAGLVVGFDEGALAAALRRLVDDEAVRGEMAGAARDRARRAFGWDAFLDRWERLLVQGVAG